jgi:hypothetical protein
MTDSNKRAVNRDQPDLTPEELFAQIVDAAASGHMPIEKAADLIGDAVASMTYRRLKEIGLLNQFADCAFAIRHVVIGMASMKLVEMKRMAAYRGLDVDLTRPRPRWR